MVKDRATGNGVAAMQFRILEAAQDLFLKKGFDNVSMRAIASRIGYSPGAIYRYFKNKKEILSVLRHEAFAGYVEQVKGLEWDDDPLERVKRHMQLYVNFALDDPELFELMFNMGPSTVALGGKWAVHPKEVYRLFQVEIAASIAAGKLPDADLEHLTILFWSTMHGYATLAVKNRLSAIITDFDSAAAAEQVMALSLRMT